MLKKHIEMKTLNEDFILQLLQHFILNRTSGNRRKKGCPKIN